MKAISFRERPEKIIISSTLISRCAACFILKPGGMAVISFAIKYQARAGVISQRALMYITRLTISDYITTALLIFNITSPCHTVACCVIALSFNDPSAY